MSRVKKFVVLVPEGLAHDHVVGPIHFPVQSFLEKHFKVFKPLLPP